MTFPVRITLLQDRNYRKGPQKVFPILERNSLQIPQKANGLQLSQRNVSFLRSSQLSSAKNGYIEAIEKMTRSDVVSSMWRTIREKCLIDPNQKQFAICDEQLFKVIGKKRFKVFGMMKYLKSHIRDPSKA
ncbi:hypothetical protein BV898_14929 [Hypsibius exemplaris]|uniref:DM2 domain-containing protein n=1 Tax=Hypsibius exemplaris TaxID=2072580 RepID=A0A9X6N9Q6_HYPEX|nr:hypothetical protein BV898_14929 [Hypsibius exemplaris]